MGITLKTHYRKKPKTKQWTTCSLITKFDNSVIFLNPDKLHQVYNLFTLKFVKAKQSKNKINQVLF